METLENELTVEFDVDGTLILNPEDYPNSKTIFITCPYDGIERKYVPHSLHINLLKGHKVRGYYITVWSAAGYMWAKAVVEALGLCDYVDRARSKPLKIIDDLPLTEAVGLRVFIPFDEKGIYEQKR